MAVYHDFYNQMMANNIIEDFANLFCQNEHSTGYIVHFGLPERFCRFKESYEEWDESIFHKTEAMVRDSNNLNKILFVT